LEEPVWGLDLPANEVLPPKAVPQFLQGEEFLETLIGLAFEDDSLGEDSVAEAILGGDGFACGRNRASGAGAVGAGGLNFALRRHAL
jgi:hypothetical protein